MSSSPSSLEVWDTSFNESQCINAVSWKEKCSCSSLVALSSLTKQSEKSEISWHPCFLGTGRPKYLKALPEISQKGAFLYWAPTDSVLLYENISIINKWKIRQAAGSAYWVLIASQGQGRLTHSSVFSHEHHKDVGRWTSPSYSQICEALILSYSMWIPAWFQFNFLWELNSHWR